MTSSSEYIILNCPIKKIATVRIDKRWYDNFKSFEDMQEQLKFHKRLSLVGSRYEKVVPMLTDTQIDYLVNVEWLNEFEDV